MYGNFVLFSSSHPKTPATRPQDLTTLFEVLKIHSEMITTLSEAVITPSETLPTLCIPIYTLRIPRDSVTVTPFDPHPPLLAP